MYVANTRGWQPHFLARAAFAIELIKYFYYLAIQLATTQSQTVVDN